MVGGSAYAQHLDVGFAEDPNDVQDFPVEVIRLEKRTPPDEDRVCNLQNTVCSLVVCFGETVDEVLGRLGLAGVVHRNIECIRGVPG